ncbi:MAG: dihydroorotate dehydrogenase electron transfer subunit [Pirellulales bacterium]|nr:dihydroorotate dehydrogenase electron transfer subunit [Pirellulales bacterium]
MSNPLHAAFYADNASQVAAEIVENVPLARNTFRVRFECPSVARQIVPGQFIMLRLAGCDDPLLGRPLAVYDVVQDSTGDAIGLDVVYLVAGKLTRRLANCRAGVGLEIWGPLGNGFSPQAAEHLIMVAGGIGQTPFLSLAKEHLGRQRYGHRRQTVARPKQITFCYGARNSEFFAGLDDFRALGIDVRLSTDDGSSGHHGFVTDVLRMLLDEPPLGTRKIVCCGPEPMMEAVAEIARHYTISCEVSLETPMACGIGICFTCVAKVIQSDGSWDYKRTCVEGPVFDAEKIAW